MIAFVRGVIAASTAAGSMQKSSSRMSTRTGVAPARRITLTVALKLNETVMTSSPGPMPSACSTASWATVPLLIRTAWRTPQYAAQASSNAAVRRPMASMPGAEDLQDGLLLGRHRCPASRSGSSVPPWVS